MKRDHRSFYDRFIIDFSWMHLIEAEKSVVQAKLYTCFIRNFKKHEMAALLLAGAID